MASREDFDDFGPSITTGLVPIKLTLPSLSAQEASQIICQQLKTDEIDPDQVEKCFNLVKQVANATVNDLSVLRNLTASALDISNSYGNGKIVKFIQNRLDSSNQLDSFHVHIANSLNLIEKYLIISAFIVSFQTSKEDIKTFSTIESFRRKKISKKMSTMDTSANSRNSDKLNIKLPKLFDQNRLFSIFYHIVQGIDPLPSPQQLQHITKSLCDRNLFKLSGNATKIDSLKYRVNVSNDFANNLAKGLEIELSNLMG